MTNKLFVLVLLALTFACSGRSHKFDWTPINSDVGNLSFNNLKDVKESQSCSDGSIGWGRAWIAVITAGFSEISISNTPLYEHVNRYEFFNHLLVDKSGDASISTATKLGGISKVKMVDNSYSITGIMSRRYCTIVYGE